MCSIAYIFHNDFMLVCYADNVNCISTTNLICIASTRHKTQTALGSTEVQQSDALWVDPPYGDALNTSTRGHAHRRKY
jgi:hypothetical protein